MDQVSTLSTDDLQQILGTFSGAKWAEVARITADEGVTGADFATNMDNPTTLRQFLIDDLGLNVSLLLSKKLHQRLLSSAAPAAASVAATAKPYAIDALHVEARAARDTERLLVALKVHFLEPAAGKDRKLMVRIPADACPLQVKRCIIDKLEVPLFSTIVLAKEGTELADSQANVDWSNISFVHARMLPQVSTLSPTNLATHACIASVVVQSSTRNNNNGSSSRAHMGGGLESGLHLVVDDARPPLGNGAFGVTFRGTVTAPGSRTNPQVVAVKQFFMLRDPALYGLASVEATEQWCTRELYPEINTLLGLCHPNLVRLRCVGLQTVHGKQFPGYIAMDFCSAGTLQSWIQAQRVTDDLKLDFTEHLLDAMTYLHVKARVIHRDLKPDNIFVDVNDTRGRHVLVVGDVGLAKKVSHTLSKVSNAGAPAYMAPEVLRAGGQHQCSFASDVYSMSLVFVEMVQGAPIQHDTDAVHRAAKQAASTMIRLLDYASPSTTLTADVVRNVAQACTQADPGQRCTMASLDPLRKRHAEPMAKTGTVVSGGVGRQLGGATPVEELTGASSVACTQEGQPISQVRNPAVTAEQPTATALPTAVAQADIGVTLASHASATDAKRLEQRSAPANTDAKKKKKKKTGAGAARQASTMRATPVKISSTDMDLLRDQLKNGVAMQTMKRLRLTPQSKPYGLLLGRDLEGELLRYISILDYSKRYGYTASISQLQQWTY